MQSPALPGGLPQALLKDFSFEAVSAGSLRVLKKGRARRRNLVLIVIAAVFWNGFIALIVASFIWGPPPGWVVQCDPLVLALASPFILLFGAALIWMVFWRLFGREEWLISTNCLDWQGRLLGFKWRRRYEDAEPVIWAAKRSGLSHLVIPLGKSKWRVTRMLYDSYNLDNLIAIGEVLTACTGWPVTIVPYDCD